METKVQRNWCTSGAVLDVIVSEVMLFWHHLSVLFLDEVSSVSVAFKETLSLEQHMSFVKFLTLSSGKPFKLNFFLTNVERKYLTDKYNSYKIYIFILVLFGEEIGEEKFVVCICDTLKAF